MKKFLCVLMIVTVVTSIMPWGVVAEAANEILDYGLERIFVTPELQDKIDQNIQNDIKNCYRIYLEYDKNEDDNYTSKIIIRKNNSDYYEFNGYSMPKEYLTFEEIADKTENFARKCFISNPDSTVAETKLSEAEKLKKIFGLCSAIEKTRRNKDINPFTKLVNKWVDQNKPTMISVTNEIFFCAIGSKFQWFDDYIAPFFELWSEAKNAEELVHFTGEQVMSMLKSIGKKTTLMESTEALHKYLDENISWKPIEPEIREKLDRADDAWLEQYFIFTEIRNSYDSSWRIEAKSTNLSGIIQIPSSYRGKSVTEISSFKNCTDIVVICVPKSIRKIEADAFDGCENLKTLGYEGTIDRWNKEYGCIYRGTYKYTKFESYLMIELNDNDDFWSKLFSNKSTLKQEPVNVIFFDDTF